MAGSSRGDLQNVVISYTTWCNRTTWLAFREQLIPQNRVRAHLGVDANDPTRQLVIMLLSLIDRINPFVDRFEVAMDLFEATSCREICRNMSQIPHYTTVITDIHAPGSLS